MTRVNELLRREIGSALFRVVDDNAFDMSSVTVTQVQTSNDLRTAKVMISIRGHEKRKTAMLALLRKHRIQIQELLAKNVILKYTPRIHFTLDSSIEEGDKVLKILHDLEETEPGNP